MTTISFKLEDEELEAFLDEQENRSEAIREAIRLYRWKENGIDDPRLSERQRAAYEWMLEQTDGGGFLPIEVAQTVLAQTLSLQKEVIKMLIFRKLRRCGYIRVVPRLYDVRLEVLPPGAVDVPESSAESTPKRSESEESPGLSVDDPDEAADRLEELASATPVR